MKSDNILPEYNGYVNYPTWLLAHHIQNNEAEFNAWSGAAEQAYDDALHEIGSNPDCRFSAKEIAIGAVSLKLREQFVVAPVIAVCALGGSTQKSVGAYKSVMLAYGSAVSSFDMYDLQSPYSDLLQFAMSFVDWVEVATMLVEDVIDVMAYEEENK